MSDVKSLLAAANAAVPRISAEEARRLIAEEDGLLVDVRDPSEVAASGKLQRALNVSRGMLEFRADEATPYHNANFRKNRPIVLYCASGGRSALAAATLRDMGFERTYNLGGFKEAAETGFEIEPA